jgi:hypothetical protein
MEKKQIIGKFIYIKAKLIINFKEKTLSRIK